MGTPSHWLCSLLAAIPSSRLQFRIGAGASDPSFPFLCIYFPRFETLCHLTPEPSDTPNTLPDLVLYTSFLSITVVLLRLSLNRTAARSNLYIFTGRCSWGLLSISLPCPRSSHCISPSLSCSCVYSLSIFSLYPFPMFPYLFLGSSIFWYVSCDCLGRSGVACGFSSRSAAAKVGWVVWGLICFPCVCHISHSVFVLRFGRCHGS